VEDEGIARPCDPSARKVAYDVASRRSVSGIIACRIYMLHIYQSIAVLLHRVVQETVAVSLSSLALTSVKRE